MKTKTRKKADTVAIRAALDSGATLEEAISAGFRDDDASAELTDAERVALASDTKHDFRGDAGEPCAICGKAHDDPIHYGAEEATADEEMASSPQAAPPEGQGENPAQPHSFKPADGNPMQCAVCGQMADADVHDVEMAHMDPNSEAALEDGDEATIDTASIILSDGRRLVGLFAVAVDDSGFHPTANVIDLRPQLAELAPAPVEEGDSPDAAPAEVVAPATGGARFKTLLALEGTPTDDGRLIEEGALTWRELPLTLMAMVEEPEMGGHGGAQVAGRIETITREAAQIVGLGTFDTGTFGAEIARLVGERTLRGVSVDLAIKEYEERWGDDIEGGTTDPMMGESFMLVVKAAVIMGATVCPFPAFADAGIEITASGKPTILHVATEDGVYTGMTVAGEFAPVAAPDMPTPPGGGSLMLALFPTSDQAAALADPDGNVPADQLHVTLFAQVGSDVDTVTQLVDQFAGGYASLNGVVGGAATFGGITPGQEGEPAEGQPDGDETPAAPGAPDAPAPTTGGDDEAPQVLVIDAPGLGELRFDLADALEAAGISYAEDHDFTPHITTDYNDAADMAHNIGLIGTAVTFPAISIVDADGTRTDVPLTTGLTASAAGLVSTDAPPSEWFDYPFDVVPDDDIVPFTVTEDGRVYGHVALFNECHIGSPKGRCITAPHHYRADDGGRCAVCGSKGSHGHSASGYDYFHLGQIETADGELVNVGQITLGTGHAPIGAGVTPKAAAAHYDNTGMATCDVRCYENRMGVVVAGALRGDAPASKVRDLKAAKISGDWRSIRGHHELVGLLAVNIPGFPIPRTARGVTQSDNGPRELALVAAGIVPDEPTDELVEHRERRDQMREMVRRERMRLLLRRVR